MNWGGLRDPLSHFPQQYPLPKQIKLLSMSQMNDGNAETGDGLLNSKAQKNSRKGDTEILIK